MNAAPRILRAGDSVVVAEFEERIDPSISDRALALAAAIAAERLVGVRDIIPTYRTVAVHFDPVRVDRERLLELLQREAARDDHQGAAKSSLIRLPVCYGGPFGPDLEQLAAWSGMREEDVVALHTAIRYRVFMLGFLPGFAYLGQVDSRIAMPRRDTPRVRVPRGAVGIAGTQTAVYPDETPGGWQIIGRTPAQMFDLSRPEPFLLKPGDFVEFYQIDARAIREAEANEAAA
jgi:inhibitor of KinA